VAISSIDNTTSSTANGGISTGSTGTPSGLSPATQGWVMIGLLVVLLAGAAGFAHVGGSFNVGVGG
jgi:hypothetical protein